MARHAIAVTAARADLVARLNAAMAAGANGASRPPGSASTTRSPTGSPATPALAVEDWLRDALAAVAADDADAGSARSGAHRADMTLVDRTPA